MRPAISLRSPPSTVNVILLISVTLALINGAVADIPTTPPSYSGSPLPSWTIYVKKKKNSSITKLIQ